DHVIRKDANGGYTSNNPFAPEDFDSFPFETHNIGKFRMMSSYNFGQKYYTYPDGKFNVPNYKFLELHLIYEIGFADNIKEYNLHLLHLIAVQKVYLINKGNFNYLVSAENFFNVENIVLVDYKHFSGNQFRVAKGNVLNQSNLL